MDSIVQVDIAHDVIQCNYPSDYAVVIFSGFLHLYDLFEITVVRTI